MLTKLDVVNAQIATRGESPITEPELATYPLAQQGLLDLREQSRLFQARGWWFNTIRVDFNPDPVTGAVEFPCGILRIEGTDIEGLSIRGNAIYDHRAQELRTTTVPKVVCIVELAFEDLPPTAQSHVKNLAVLAFADSYDTTQSRLDSLRRRVLATGTEVTAEHIRSVRSNRLLMPDVLSKIVSIGIGGGRSGLPVR